MHRRVCPILRTIFKQRWKQSETSEWQDSADNGKLYITGIGALVYKNAGTLQKLTFQHGDLSHWDFHTLAKILTQSNFKRQNEWNTKETQHIDQLIKVCEKADSSPTKTMKDESFLHYWDKIEQLLVLLGDSEQEIEVLRLSPTLTESDLLSSDSGRGSATIMEHNIPEAEDLKDRAKSAMRKNEFDQALTMITKAISLPGLPSRELGAMYATRSEIYLQKGKSFPVADIALRNENFYMALKDAKSALNIRPVWGVAYYKVGMAYWQLGKLPKATKFFDQALDLEPNVKKIQQAQRQCRGKLRKPSTFERIEDDVFLEQSGSEISSPEFFIPGRTCYSPENQMRMDYLLASEDETFSWVLKGHQYRDGRKVSQDFRKAAAYYKKAVKNKNTEAMYNLALLKLEGRGTNQDISGAISLLKAAALEPHNSCQGVNGSLSVTNVGVTDSQFVLGILSEEGIGCLQKSSFQASVWYREASDHGNGPAAHNLGLLYSTGRGVMRDEKQALQLWKLGATRKVPEAMIALGIHCLKEWDTSGACKWVDQALKTSPAFHTGNSRGATMSLLGPEEIAKFQCVVKQMERWRRSYGLKEIAKWEKSVFHSVNKDATMRERLIKFLKSKAGETEKIEEVERYLSCLNAKPVKIPFPLAKAVSVSKSEAYMKRGFSFSGSISRASNLSSSSSRFLPSSVSFSSSPSPSPV